MEASEFRELVGEVQETEDAVEDGHE